MATRVITIHVDDQPVEVTLKAATKADGLWRAELMQIPGSDAMKNDSELRRQAAFFLFPTCVAAVKAPENIRHMSLDDFLNRIDEADVDMWITEAYELNPQWRRGWRAVSRMVTDLGQLTRQAQELLDNPVEQPAKTEEIQHSGHGE